MENNEEMTTFTFDPEEEHTGQVDLPEPLPSEPEVPEAEEA